MKMLIMALAIAFLLMGMPAFAAGPQQGAKVADERIHSISDLRESIAAQKDELVNETKSLKADVKELRDDQNRVRLAVHAFLSMENLTGGIGRNVSAIARDFNNSVRARERLEDRIRNRNFIVRVLFGGDEQTAQQLVADLNMTDGKLAELRQLREQCNCTSELKAEMQAQIDGMVQEQLRLRNLTESEMKDRGWLGWLWKR